MVVQKGVRGNQLLKTLYLEGTLGTLHSRIVIQRVLGETILPAYFCCTKRLATKPSLHPGHSGTEERWLALIELHHTQLGVFLSSHHNRCTLLD